jgi:hypothetical protein
MKSKPVRVSEWRKKNANGLKLKKGLENLSHYLDGLFKVPVIGWRFGLDALVGLIPNVGDTVTSLASFYILVAGVRYGVPKITLLRMAFNIGLGLHRRRDSVYWRCV